MALALAEWNAEHDAQCVDIGPALTSTALRVTIRTNAESMTDRDVHARELAVQAAPDNGIAARATVYSQFSSDGYTYVTYVVTWL